MAINLAVARFLTSEAPAQLPVAVLAQVRRGIVNAVGAALFARADPTIEALRDWAVARAGACGAHPLLWDERRASAHDAALVNAALIHIADFDDTHRPTYVHTAAPLLATVLAVAPGRQVSGFDALRAYGLAVEAELLYAELLFPSHYLRGFHITATVGAIGAAAVGSVLLGLDEAATTHALGLAMATSSGLVEMLGTSGNAYQVGNSAGVGLAAAQLAAAGLDSVPTAFDGLRGFRHATSDAEAGAQDATETLGRTWRALDISYKAIATETITQAPVEAVLGLRARMSDDRRARVVGIEVVCKPIVGDVVRQRAAKFGDYPTEPMQAKFDIRYCVAAAWLRGRWTPAELAAEALADPAIRRVRDAIRITSSGRAEGNDVLVRLELDDGTTEEQYVAAFRGSAENPMTDDELTRKLIDSAPDAAYVERAGHVAELVWNLDALPDIAPLVAALSGGGTDAA